MCLDCHFLWGIKSQEYPGNTEWRPQKQVEVDVRLCSEADNPGGEWQLEWKEGNINSAPP